MMKLPDKEKLRFSKTISPWVESGERMPDGTIKLAFKKDTPPEVVVLFNKLKDKLPQYS